MTDFSDMLSKAKAMQEKMKAAQEQIKKFKKNKIAQDIQEAFPDAKLIDIIESE